MEKGPVICAWPGGFEVPLESCCEFLPEDLLLARPNTFVKRFSNIVVLFSMQLFFVDYKINRNFLGATGDLSNSCQFSSSSSENSQLEENNIYEVCDSDIKF